MTNQSLQELSKKPTIEQIENELFYLKNGFPKDGVQAAIDQQSAITPKLITCLSKAIEDVSRVEDNDIGHLFAVFLLSQFQEKKAFELIIRLARLPEEDIDYLIGDCITDDLQRFIASTYNGDLPAIKNLIEDTEVNLWSRVAGIESLIILINEEKLEVDETALYLSSLFTHPSFSNDHHLIAYLILSCCALDPQRFHDEIHKAFEEQKVDTFVVDRADFKKSLANPEAYKTNGNYTLIKDTIAELQYWPCFEDSEVSVPDSMISKPIIQDAPKIGRNEPCPCNSGKKYKQCCLTP
ncbi:MAG: DUF1186 domain-containing protein [Legionella sp.]|nr:DUF1186 domain-containing protein [Legionella sp.]